MFVPQIGAAWAWTVSLRIGLFSGPASSSDSAAWAGLAPTPQARGAAGGSGGGGSGGAGSPGGAVAGGFVSAGSAEQRSPLVRPPPPLPAHLSSCPGGGGDAFPDLASPGGPSALSPRPLLPPGLRDSEAHRHFLAFFEERLRVARTGSGEELALLVAAACAAAQQQAAHLSSHPAALGARVRLAHFQMGCLSAAHAHAHALGATRMARSPEGPGGGEAPRAGAGAGASIGLGCVGASVGLQYGRDASLDSIRSSLKRGANGPSAGECAGGVGATEAEVDAAEAEEEAEVEAEAEAELEMEAAEAEAGEDSAAAAAAAGGRAFSTLSRALALASAGSSPAYLQPALLGKHARALSLDGFGAPLPARAAAAAAAPGKATASADATAAFSSSTGGSGAETWPCLAAGSLAVR